MKTKQVQHIIRSFFGKRFSKEIQMRFRYWLRLEESSEEKEKTMLELWQASPSDITSGTWSELSKIQERIGCTQTVYLYSSLYKWRKYVAVAAIVIIATAVTTHLLIRPDIKVVSPELVEFFVPYGDCQQVRLADGSSVWVNAGSLLVYPKAFTADTRTVYLSGEARFEVAKNPDKPFIVHTHHLDVQALGTVFSVEAYPNVCITLATLEEGSIRVDTKSADLPASMLKPNEQLVYSHQIHQVTIHTIDAKQVALWKDGYLIVENCSFDQLIAALQRKYNVTINYNAQKYKGRSYFVKFNPDESLEDALLILSHLIDDFRFKLEDKIVSIN